MIFIDDNPGQWRSDSANLLRYCLRPAAAGRSFVERLRPDDEDYFVLKPMHSAFNQMRNFKNIAPPDCAARSAPEQKQALQHIRAMAGANVVKSSSLRLERFLV